MKRHWKTNSEKLQRASKGSSGTTNATQAGPQMIPHRVTTLHLHIMFSSIKLITLGAALCKYHACCIVNSLTRRICGQKDQTDLQKPVQVHMASNKLELMSSVRTKLPVSEQHFPEAQIPRGLISSGT